jgi:cyclopropane fatty-acyl-phospholipid synthase-like methyltransferase
MKVEIFEQLGAKPSTSEERGLAQLHNNELSVFSPGISTAGFAEIRMAKTNPDRKIIATTIDKKGLEFAREIIKQVGIGNQIETRDEDLRSPWNYPPNYFDFIYARLVLHYLSAQELDRVLAGFSKSLITGGRTFIIVRSVKSINPEDPNHNYDPQTRFTTESFIGKNGEIVGTGLRYFHTSETIREHLQKAGLQIDSLEEYPETLYKDFLRKEKSQTPNFIIEAVARK